MRPARLRTWVLTGTKCSEVDKLTRMRKSCLQQEAKAGNDCRFVRGDGAGGAGLHDGAETTC